MSGSLEKIKEIAEKMPECLEKQQALQAYSNLKMFETIADSFVDLVDPDKQPETRQKTHWAFERISSGRGS